MAYGDLGAVVDTLTFTTFAAHCNENAHVVDDIFCVSSRWGSGSNYVFTFSIDSLGEISDAVIDDILHHTQTSDDRNKLAKLTDSIYAIATVNATNELTIDTIEIHANGQITDTCLDKHLWDGSNCLPGKLVKCGPGLLALAFDNNAHSKGHLWTIRVYGDGSIEPVIVDTLEFDPTTCNEPHLAEIHPGIWAITYIGPDGHGFIKTVSISAGGIIGSVLDTFEFDGVKVYYPTIAKAHGDFFAIGYTATAAGDGKLAIVEIGSGGAITEPVVDTCFFQTRQYSYNCTFSFRQGYIGVAYSDPNGHGILKTFLVDGDGKLNDTVIDTLDFCPAGAMWPHVIHHSGDVWAVTHTAAGTRGQVTSFGLETPPAPARLKDLMRGMLR